MTDRVRERWERGEGALNAWLGSTDPSSAGAFARAGFDAVTVDLQHGSASPDDLGPLAAAISDAGAVPFARLRWNDPGLIMRALDLGALGVICPMVDSREQAEVFVRACRYPPLGARSYGPVQGAFGVGREHTEAANAAVLTFAQIETAAALARVSEIAATPGLDGLYVGPADLSLSLGLENFADLGDPRMLEALRLVVAASRTSGVVPGIHAPGTEPARAMLGLGFGFVGAGGDAELHAEDAPERVLLVRGSTT